MARQTTPLVASQSKNKSTGSTFAAGKSQENELTRSLRVKKSAVTSKKSPIDKPKKRGAPGHFQGKEEEFLEAMADAHKVAAEAGPEAASKFYGRAAVDLYNAFGESIFEKGRNARKLIPAVKEASPEVNDSVDNNSANVEFDPDMTRGGLVQSEADAHVKRLRTLETVSFS